MKKINLFILFLWISTGFITHDSLMAHDEMLPEFSVPESVSKECTCKGVKLYGRVRVVTSFPDLRVMKVDGHPDLRVLKVEAFPDECGRWLFVKAHEDFTIQYVDAHADLRVRFVEAFPGLP